MLLSLNPECESDLKIDPYRLPMLTPFKEHLWACLQELKSLSAGARFDAGQGAKQRADSHRWVAWPAA